MRNFTATVKEGVNGQPFIVLEADIWHAGNHVILVVDGDLDQAVSLAEQLNAKVEYVGHIVGRTAFETGLFG